MTLLFIIIALVILAAMLLRRIGFVEALIALMLLLAVWVVLTQTVVFR